MINKNCSYFPCHKALEDCTFCYCPLYPCKDTNRGKFVISSKSHKKVWSCRECSWIHSRKVVDRIYKSIRKDHALLNDKAVSNDAGIVLLGHGSRLKAANDTIFDIAKKIAQRCDNAVETAFLQLAKPVLSESIKKLVRKKYKKIVIVPCFLMSGNHVQKDIPELIGNEKKKNKGIDFVCTRHLGANTKIVDLVFEKIKEVVRDHE